MPRSYCRNGGGHHHGAAAPDEAYSRRAVPSRKHCFRARPRLIEELPPTSGGTHMTDLKPLIAKAAGGEPLSREEARAAFDVLMSGDATPSQIGGFLMALRVR